MSSDDQPQTIEVFYGNLALDFGVATIPRLAARFWPYLVHTRKLANGKTEMEQLVDWEYAILLQVLILRDEQDFELRAENLPIRSPESSVERLKAKLRRMGLVFTQRIYYPARPGKPPSMRSQRWDMRSLFYNLEMIARQWLAGNNKLVDEWALKGRRGKKPIYSFPPDFKHETVLPVDVAVDLVRGVFFPTPDEWQGIAVAQLGDVPTAHHMRGRMPTTHVMRGHLFKTDSDSIDSDSDGGGEGNTPRQTVDNSPGEILLELVSGLDPNVGSVVMEFAGRCDIPQYLPSPKEIQAVQALFAEGFQLDEIIAGITKSFEKSKSPPRSLMYCVRVIRQNRVEVSKTDYAKRQSVLPVEIDDNLMDAAVILGSAGHEINESVLARLRLMAQRADEAARRQHGVTGAQWLTDALRTGLGVSKNGALINYADSVLDSWIQNGKQQPIKKTTTKRGRNAKPTVAAPSSRSTRWPSDSD